MKLEALKKLIREEMRTVIKEELKDILTEAVIIASKPDESQIPTIQKLNTKSISETINHVSLKETKSQSTGNPLMDLLQETADSGEWKTLGGDTLNSANAANFMGGQQFGGGAQTPVVNSVAEMGRMVAPTGDINSISIDAVPDFTGLMGALKEKGKI